MVAPVIVRSMMVPACVIAAAAGHAQSSGTAGAPSAKKESEVKAAGQQPIAGDVLRKRLVGNTSYLIFLGRLPKTATSGISFAMYYPSDRERISVRPDETRSTTLWWMEGNQICGEEKQTMPGGAANRCYLV